MIPSGNVENPGVKGDNGECRLGISENFLGWVCVRSDNDDDGEEDGGLAFRGGKMQS